MSGGIEELVAQAESSPALIEAQANVSRLQAKVREAKEALGGASRGIQIAKHAVAGTLVDGGTADVLSLEDAVEREKTARLLFEATEEALSDAWSRLREAKQEARRDVVPELARRHAESIEELATEFAGRAKIAKVNVDEAPDLAARYGVMSIPTLLFIKDGEVVERLTGAAPKRELAARLDSILVAV